MEVIKEKEWRAAIQEEVKRVHAGQKLSPEFQTKFQARFVMASETILSTAITPRASARG